MPDLRIFRTPELNPRGKEALDRVSETIEQTYAILEALGVEGRELKAVERKLLEAGDCAKRSLSMKPENQSVVRRPR